MHSYPKVYALGHAAIGGLLLDAVIIQEKLDGSQFSFGIEGGELKMKSRNAIVDPANPGMFALAVETVQSRQHLLVEGRTYRCEYLMKHKHNTLTYARVPKGHLVLFDVNVGHEAYCHFQEVEKIAVDLGIDMVPTLHTGHVVNPGFIKDLLGSVSFLGGTQIEGVVVKNYGRFGRDGRYGFTYLLSWYPHLMVVSRT